MEFKVEDGALKKIQTTGDILEVASELQNAKLRLSSLQAKKARLEPNIAIEQSLIEALQQEGPKLPLPEGELAKEDKIQLVSLGLKTPDDFPGDDWLAKYQTK